MDDLIKVYGASWCNDCRRAKKFLSDQRVSYEWFDIEHDPSLIEEVHARNDGKNIIPTIVFPDGTHLARSPRTRSWPTSSGSSGWRCSTPTT